MKKLIVLLLCMHVFCCAVEPQCFRELARDFFNNDQAIMQALSLHEITESSWTPIVKNLQRNSKNTISIIHQRARLMDVNPLNPFQEKSAEQLLTVVLMESFQSVLNSYLITNPTDIREMFNYIKAHQVLWNECFNSE